MVGTTFLLIHKSPLYIISTEEVVDVGGRVKLIT